MFNSKLAGVQVYPEKFYLRLIYFLSAVVFLLVIFLSRLPKAETIPGFVKFLPALNAFLNGTTSVLLMLSFYFIRRKKIDIHRRLNITAMILSTIFLLSYVTFHSFGIETKFPADNPFRPVYLVILSSHILLAAIVLPLVLISLYRGLTNQVLRHKKIVRWSFPIWLYVTITGVIVYLMISPYYQFWKMDKKKVIMKKYIFTILFLLIISVSSSWAQCAMCKRTAETDFQSKQKPTAGKSLNSGILYLLSIPYLIGAVGAIAWYKNRRKGS